MLKFAQVLTDVDWTHIGEWYVCFFLVNKVMQLKRELISFLNYKK